jgi:L-lactate utilization protein LutB
MDKWNKLADLETINKTIESLKANGINARFVQTGIDAKKEVLDLIPKGAEVMNMTSTTLDTIGIPQELNDSGKFNSSKNKLSSMNMQTQGLEMQKLGAAPDWAVGSVHAVTEEGHVFVVSNTGSQLPAYSYGAAHVIWVVGAQKIVKNDAEALRRINEYVLPLESERANKAYNIATGSFVSKILIVNREINPARITLIFVGEVLGF